MSHKQSLLIRLILSNLYLTKHQKICIFKLNLQLTKTQDLKWSSPGVQGIIKINHLINRYLTTKFESLALRFKAY